MTKLCLPSPHEPFVDSNGRISEIWYRYLSKEVALSSSLENASARAWGYISVVGTVATVADSYNLSSSAIASTVGTVAVTFSVPFASTGYAVVGVTISTARATTGFSIVSSTTSASGQYSFACYGDQ